MKNKPSVGGRILVFFISLMILIFLFPFLAIFLTDEMMWRIIPFIPLVAIMVACIYDKFNKNK